MDASMLIYYLVFMNDLVFDPSSPTSLSIPRITIKIEKTNTLFSAAFDCIDPQ